MSQRSIVATGFAAACVAAVIGFVSPAAVADTPTRTAMPVISAHVEGDQLRLRLADAAIGRTPATRQRTVLVEALDAAGVVTASREIMVGRRLTYAARSLPAEFTSADRLSVTVR
ncbi:hypothetical protein GC169_10260 [bacterium]|nr:hypothetical protein [bacterium]